MTTKKTLLCLCLVFLCSTFLHAGNNTKELNIINPVLPGDRPDPTIIKIGDTYWASATSNEWAPLFPIFKSKDMVNWELVSYVFPDGPPEWALNNFWAPELSYDSKTGKVFIYYTARAKETNQLAVAVASADKPDGKYTDHGYLVCQEAGSIDAFEITDEKGKIYVVWKEDGNSRGKATPIWAQEINQERTRLTGNPVELFRNNEADNNSWERWLIEGVCIFKKDKYYYATYSGGSCCDTRCNYKTGIARSKSILGPWEKYEKNPILTDNESWKCAGHGTVAQKGNDFYYLYHAYSTTGGVYVGREGILQKIEWTTDGWPYFKNDATYNRPLESLNFTENFSSSMLNPLWQWRVTQNIDYHIDASKRLVLGASKENRRIGTLLVQQTKVLDYTLKAKIDIENSGNNTLSGIALVGGIDNEFGAPLAATGIYAGKEGIEIKRNQKEICVLTYKDIREKQITLIMDVTKGYLISFGYETEGKTIMFPEQINASGLVPWGMGFRFGLVSYGPQGEYGVFKQVQLLNK